MATRALVAICVALAVSGSAEGKGAFEATDANFESAVLNSGKNAFVKFLAPWCGHCKSMKPDWDKLGQKYADSESVMIVDVDCTVHEQTCQKVGVKGYPTIKYYMAGSKSGKDYQQGRDYASLSSFAESTLNKPMCNVQTMKGCQANEKKFIEAQSTLDVAAMKVTLAEKEEEGKAIKKERSDLAKETKEKEKEWKKKEKGHTMAKSILKQLIAAKEKAAKDL